MALDSTSENVVKPEEHAPPSPGHSKIKIPSALSRLNPSKIFNRKKSGSDMTVEGSIKAVEQVAENVIGSLTHETSSVEYKNYEDGKSSTEPHEQSNWGEKLAGKIEKTKDALKHEVKEGLGKVEASIDTTLKDIMTFVHKDPKSNEDNNNNPTNEQVDISDEPSPLKQNEGTSNENNEDENNNKKEEKIENEDYCASSLAQGLQKICALWSSNKED